jgi:hypothetical protein
VSKYCKKCGDKLKERASPSQIETCIVRISKVAKEILQKEVDKNESSIELIRSKNTKKVR